MSIDAEHDKNEVVSSGLCELCGEDAALPDNSFCGSCWESVQEVLLEWFSQWDKAVEEHDAA